MKSRRKKVMEDWTWKERKMRWKLVVIARVEEKRGIKVWLSYGRIRIGEQGWTWDEKVEVLRDIRSAIRRQRLGKARMGRKEE